MPSSSLRVEERFIPGEYLIKAYPELRYNRRKGFVGFLTNLRLFFGDGRQLHDLSLGSVDAITWGRVRRWSVWIMLFCEILAFILLLAIVGFVLIFLVPILWWFWREDAVTLKVGPKEVIIFGEARTLNDIAKNIRLHQAVLRSGEAGGALGQRILEAMPMEARPPPEEGGPLAAEYARRVAGERETPSLGNLSLGGHDDEGDLTSSDHYSSADHYYGPGEPIAGKKKRQIDDWQGREALELIEGQASDTDRSLAARLAYLLWAGPPNPTKLMLIFGHILLFLAILIFVIADTIAYFNEEAASPWTRFAQLLVMGGLGAFLAVISRQVDNRYRGVEPDRDEVIMKLGYKDYPLRYLCHRSAHFFILTSLALTFLFMNLSAFLVGAFLGSFLMAGGRIVNLLMKPQWMHLTKPWPKWRSIKLCWNGVRLFSIFIALVVLFPYFQDHDAALPSAQLDAKVHNGWVLEADHSISRGLGAVQGGLRLYFDDGRNEEGDSDGYPAILVLITLKEPRDFATKRLVDLIREMIDAQMKEQEVVDEYELALLSRTTVQGYQTSGFIYNATADGSTYLTKGEEVRVIGEGWYAREQNVMVVAVGFAQISSETLDKDPAPPEELPDPVRDTLEAIWELLPDEVQKQDPPIDPTNTTDTRNWLELYDLVPQVEAW